MNKQLELLETCVQLRKLLIRIQQSPKISLVAGTKEAKAIKNALDIMDTRLRDGHNKSKALAGIKRKETVTQNSEAIAKLRAEERMRAQAMVETYFNVVEKSKKEGD